MGFVIWLSGGKSDVSQVTVCVEPTGHTLLAVGLVILGAMTSLLWKPKVWPSSSAIRPASEEGWSCSGEAATKGLVNRSANRRKRERSGDDVLDSIVDGS